MGADQHDRARSQVDRRLTVAVGVAAVVCCAAPLLIAAGLVASAGVLLRNLALVGAGLLLVGWPVARAIKRLRRSANRIDPPGSTKGSVDPTTTTPPAVDAGPGRVGRRGRTA